VIIIINYDNKKNSILIVDDSELQRFILAEILETEYVIHMAKNGIEAIEYAKKYLPDLILMDVIMPEMDGYQTFLEIRKSEKIKNIPVIFVTSLNDEDNEIKGLGLNAIDYISKPYNFEILKLRVHNNIQRINQLRITEDASFTDMLTNLPNRRGFDIKIGQEWRRSMREQKFLSILLIDIDKFKSVNDIYGHLQGDVVLKTISEIFSQELKRGSDFVARWGGEEFVALLSNTSLEETIQIAERIRLNVESANIPCDNNQTIKITISIGINSEIPKKGDMLDDFIKMADVALYTAKKNGRNRLYWNC